MCDDKVGILFNYLFIYVFLLLNFFRCFFLLSYLSTVDSLSLSTSMPDTNYLVSR